VTPLPGHELEPADLAALEKCGVPADLVAQALLRRVSSADGAAIVGRKNGTGDFSGVLFPYIWPGEDGVREYRLRRDRPEVEYKDGRPRDRAKYLSPPGRGNMLYFVPGTDPAWLQDASVPVVITEGEKKTLALWRVAWHDNSGAKPRFLPVGLSGVWNWRGTVGKQTGPNGDREDVKGPIPDLARIEWRQRRVFLLFDTNVTSNPSVRAARKLLGVELRGRGAEVLFVDLPDVAGVNGVDDLLGLSGPARVLAIFQTAKPATAVEFHETDLGNAERLVAAFGADLRYCGERGVWFIWNGQRWRLDESCEVDKLANRTIRQAFADAGDIDDAERRKAYLRFLFKSESQRALTAMVQRARSLATGVTPEELDRDPWLLNAPNGVVDLRTGALLPHAREYLASKLTGAEYRPEATCPLFENFLGRIMGVSPEASEGELDRADRMVAYLQKAFGYAATGHVTEKAVFVFYGSGNNGKTTLLEVIAAALGEYAGRIQIETLTTRQEIDNTVNTDMADLFGKRFVASSECEDNRRLAVARLKHLSGMGTLKARRLRENCFEWRPTHKLFLDTNFKPVIRGTEDATWDRLHCVPFSVTIPPAERDRALLEKLKAELPGVLAWIVRGALRWRAEGLERPPEVQEATDRYREESDPLAEFLEDRCQVDPQAWVASADLWRAYLAWAEGAGEKFTVSRRRFAEHLEARGFKSVLRREGAKVLRQWRGLNVHVGVL
jgi:P4 family phage/plasmid primase-like protien